MSGTSLKFGTSGLRGLAAELDGPPAYAYALAFITMLKQAGRLRDGMPVFIGRDLRPSSPSIAALCMAAVEDAGCKPVDCGVLPTPALSFYAMARQAPSIMITGSHIPDDRNGLKFYRADGEIDKQDEQAIAAAHAALPAGLSVRHGKGEAQGDAAVAAYISRYADFLEDGHLKGLRVGVYQHSSVARDIVTRILGDLGADTVALGRSDIFVPVDTEALRPADIDLLHRWAGEDRFDAIVSTDGDADRPLVADERGRFVRGDLVGAITADWLGADAVVTPVTSNTALEECGRFARVVRTRVGSPYVIEGMAQAARDGARTVIGFEANGGVLLGSSVEKAGRRLDALPTRDAMLPILACLATIRERQKPLSEIARGFGFRIALSDRLQDVPPERSAPFLASLSTSDGFFGGVARVETIDGVKLFLASGNAVHYRASGNAPELRCYVEAANEDQARALLARGLDVARNATKDA